MRAPDIPKLNANLIALNDKISALKARRSQVDSEINITRTNIKRIRKRISTANRRKVSDHAMVRYMERIMGVNIHDLEQTIIDCERCTRIEKDGIIVSITTK